MKMFVTGGAGFTRLQRFARQKRCICCGLA